MRARLTVEQGAATPRFCDLNDGAAVRLGRNRDNEIILTDSHASRWHAQIFASNGRWFLRDLNTTNGTRVGGAPVTGEAPLDDNTEIDIGDTRLRFCLDGSKTDELPVLTPDEEPHVVPADDEGHTTVLEADELTTLFRFMNTSLAEAAPHRLVGLALEAVRQQTGAELAGFLSLDAENPDFMLVLPASATIDRHLSHRLTQKVLQDGRSVWLESARDRAADGDSLSNFRDALCIPLRAGQGPADGPAGAGATLGALHVYKCSRPFTGREVRFCEVLAGSLAATLHVLRARRALEADNSRLRVHAASPGDELIGDSPALRQLRQQVRRLAEFPCTVLVVGESGTGKELVALALHRHSARHDGALVTVNCAAISASVCESELFGHAKGSFTGATQYHPGYFEQAAMGTLFLDEIGELSPDLQAKLLRAIETKKIRPVGAQSDVKVDVRIIAATNRDLEREVREGRFRKDLFFRLTSRVDVPPLREHAEDIPDLVRHFLGRLNAEYRRRVTLSEAALRRLQGYSWPGNVRQLRSVLEAAAVTAPDNGVLHAGDLRLAGEAGAPEGGPPSLNLEELEAWAIRQALAHTGGNNSQAARLLGIHRDTLICKVKKYGIERPA